MPLLVFSYLQILDFMSTVAFLLVGVREANPLVRLTFSIGSTPMAGLLLVKVVAVTLGVLCWYLGRKRILVFANVAFACLVAWNLVAVIAGAARIA